MRPLTWLSALSLVVVSGHLAHAQTYQEIVSLQNRAMQTGAREPSMDHRRSIEIAEHLNRPALLAVLFERLGRHLETFNIQNAVGAYEAGFRALARDPRFDLKSELNRLAAVPKGFSASANPIPVDLYSQPLASQLESAEADPLLAVHLLLDIGNAYFQQPQLAPALDRYRQALARPEIANSPKLRAYALANAGEVLRVQGDVAEAERMLQDALDLLRRFGDAVEPRRALILLAGIYRDRKEDDHALSTYTEALALYGRAPQDPRGEGRAYGALGRLHLGADRLADARAAFTRAIQLGEVVNDHASLWHAYWGLAQIQQRTGDSVGAAESLQRSLALIESDQQSLTTDEGKVTFLDSAQLVFDQLIALQLDQARTDPRAADKALDTAEQARAGAMRDLMGLQERSGLNCSPQPSGRGAGAPLAQAAPAQPSPVQMAPATRPGPLSTGPPDPRCADGRSRAAVNAPRLARLVFHVLGDRTAVFAIGSNGQTSWHIVSTGHDQLTNRIGDLRKSLEVDSNGRGISVGGASPAPAPDSYRDQLRSLYRDFIEPVESTFQPDETIVIEPHGPLWLLPFAALEDRSGRALIERWAFVYSPSDAILSQIRHEPPYEIPRDLKALVIGNPNPPNLVSADDERFRSAGVRATFQPLPGAEEEARAIADLMTANPATLLIGGQATLSQIESKLSTHTLLHLATHALTFANSPLDSFVMLTADSGNDGRLTARRVLNQRVFADIVTLSACQTGMGYVSGDGVIGLSRAFLARGARSVLVSEWSVSDGATAALMKGFYRRYLSGGIDKAHALQEAMKDVRSMSGYEHPKYWAPFVLIGGER